MALGSTVARKKSELPRIERSKCMVFAATATRTATASATTRNSCGILKFGVDYIKSRVKVINITTFCGIVSVKCLSLRGGGKATLNTLT